MSKYSKAIAAGIAAILVTAAAVSDKAISGEEWAAVAAAWGGVFAVFQVRNQKDV